MIDISNKLKDILSNVLEIDISLLTEDFSKNDTQNWDSIKHLNLILIIEEEFNIVIDDDFISQLNTFNKLLEFLNNKLN